MSDFKTLLAVGDLVSEKIVSIKGSKSVSECAVEMEKGGVTSLVVVDDGGGMLGIVTEQDIVRRGVAKGLNLSSEPVSSIMTKDPLTISHDESIFEARQIMTANGVRHLVVLKNGEPMGILGASSVLGS